VETQSPFPHQVLLVFDIFQLFLKLLNPLLQRRKLGSLYSCVLVQLFRLLQKIVVLFLQSLPVRL